MKIFPTATVVINGSSVTYNQYTIFFERIGPSSYSTANGFVIDLSATYSSVNDCKLIVKKGTRGNLGIGRAEYTYNSPSAGKITVHFFKHQFDRTSSTGNVTGQPSGVTVQAASGVASSAGSSHTHSIDHDHPVFTSGALTASGGQVLLNAIGPNYETHTHEVNIANFTGTSGAESAHTHDDNSIYQHQHATTYTSTNYTKAEVTNATNLSTTTFFCVASGVQA